MKKNRCFRWEQEVPIIKKLFRIMKLTTFLLLISVFGVLANKSYSQTLSLNMENKTLKEVLLKIENASGCNFLYSEKFIDVERKVSVNVENEDLDDVLKSLFTDTDVKIERKNRVIILSSNTEISSLQQTIKLSGKVTDVEGAPLPGVTVVIKGTTNGTITDFDGVYTLSDVPSDGIIQFSFVGMKMEEIEVDGKTSINVVLKESAIGIEEVVAIGYGTMKRADITGSVATVNSDQIIKTPTGSTINTLVGKMAGIVTKQTSGEPGSDNASLNIRGFGSPLVIVDGVERPLSEFNSMDANEIETVTILKDAASAIYGARSGNGVVLVTTKRGSVGEPVFRLNSSYSLQQTTASLKPLGSWEMATLQNEGDLNDGNPLTWTEEELELFKNGTDPQYPNTDWYDIALREFTPQHQHNLSMRGGNKKLRYYGMIGMLEQEYFYETGDSKYTRYNIRSNVDADITDDLTVSLDFSYVNKDIISPIQDAELFFETLYSTASIYPAFYPDETKLPVVGGLSNTPWTNINLDIGGYNREKTTNTNIAGTVNYKIPFVKGLSAKLFGNYREVVYRNKMWYKHIDTYYYDWENDIYTDAPGNSKTHLSQGMSFSRVLTAQASLSYDKTYKKHKISALALYEWIDNKSENISGYKENYLTTAIDYLFAGGDENQSVGGGASEFGRKSFVSRLNYSYDRKYLLQASFRADASPKFPKESRWGYFPSVSLGWRISEEAFMSSLAALDNLKLRVSYSNTGYDATGTFQYLTGYKYLSGFDPNYLMGGTPVPGLVSTGLANEYITWEEMNTYNAGVEYSFWQNKLYGEIDAFYRERNGMLATRIGSLPNTFGASLPDENINSQTNRGFEFKIGTKGKVGELRYDIEGHVSWARAKWVHYEEPAYEDPDDIRINQRSGNWTNRKFGYQDAGLFTSQEEIDNYGVDIDNQGNATVRPGYVKWIDQNGDSIINWRDQVEIGLGQVPEIYAGLTTNFQYKGFDLSLLFQGAARSTVQLPVAKVLSNQGPASIAFDPDRWTVDNNKADARFPARSNAGNTNGKPSSERWTEDGKYIRLKNAQIGYTLPNRITESIGIDNLRIYCSGTNLLTLSKLNAWDMDPEFSNTDFRGTFRGLYYPVQRLFTLGVNVSF